MENDILKVLISEEALQQKVRELGAQISRDYAGSPRKLLVLGVLKGSFVFMADLIRQITVPCQVEFMAVSSYGASTKSTGAVRILKDLDHSIEGEDVLIVEDIVDTGLTLKYLVDNLSKRGARSVRICCLLDKPARRRTEISADYAGQEIEDAFVVGYGLDYNERYRNLPYVGILKPEIYR